MRWHLPVHGWNERGLPVGDVPVVSIVICTRNRAPGLAKAVASLARIEAAEPWEVLLLDNASTDATRATILAACDADPRFSYHYCDRVGLGAAREFARKRARGRILAFTDDDCLVAPDFVDQLVQAFASHELAGCIGGRIERFNSAHLALTIDERTMVSRTAAYSFVPAGAFHGANLSFLAHALDTAGGFDPRLGAGTDFPCEDIDAVARVVYAGFEAIYDPRVIVRHDHGRVEADRRRVMASYDRGRGAYFALLIANRVTRKHCRTAWLDSAARIASDESVRSLRGEVTHALRFAAIHFGVTQLAAVSGIALRVMAVGFWTWVTSESRRAVRVR